MKNCRVHPTHWLISTQLPALRVRGLQEHAAADGEARRGRDLRRDAVAGPAHRGSMRTDRYVGSCLTSASARRSWRPCTKGYLDVPPASALFRYELVPKSWGGQPFARQFLQRTYVHQRARAPSGTKAWGRQPFVRRFLRGPVVGSTDLAAAPRSLAGRHSRSRSSRLCEQCIHTREVTTRQIWA